MSHREIALGFCWLGDAYGPYRASAKSVCRQTPTFANNFVAPSVTSGKYRLTVQRIEDSPAGVAAIAAGMPVVAVPEPEMDREHFAGADQTLGS